MEILLFLLGIIVGGLVSWGITHEYYRKSSKEQNILFNKLSEEVQDIILNDKREKLTVLELNELIKKKTIDKDIGEAIPYIACPVCGSEDLERTSDVEVEYGPEGPESAAHYNVVRCKECGWEKTSHGYESSRDNV